MGGRHTMKYREIKSYIDGGETPKVICRVMLKDGVIEYENVHQSQIDIWEESGIRLGRKVFKPQENPYYFLKWLHLENSSYCKTSPIYDEGED